MIEVFLKKDGARALERVKSDIAALREAAIADGWQPTATYAPHEDISRAMRLTKAGFVISTISRENVASIHAWGPDELAISFPLPYDYDAILASVRVCGYCGKTDVDTTRISFAGRCCTECRENKELTRRVEYDGWTR